jgi:hypothetical protein
MPAVEVVRGPSAGPRGRRGGGGVWVVAAALLVAGAGLGYAKVVRPTIVPKNFGVVQEGRVYRSGWLTPSATERVVRAHGVRTIVDLGGFDKDGAAERVAARTAAALGVERRVFRLEGDGTGNPNAYVEALRIMADPAKQPVLVHCSAGSERTGLCVMLYRELVLGEPREGLWDQTFEHGHDPARNTKLRPYLEEWGGKIAEAYRSGGSVAGRGRAEIESRAE